MGALRRCKTESEARGSAGGGDESALCDEDTPRARGSRRRDTGGAIGSREGDTGGPIEPRRGSTGGAIGPRRGDTGGTIGPEEETREVSLNLEEGTQEALSDPAEEIREAPSDREDEAQGTPSDPEEETVEAPSDPEEGTLEAPSDPEEETREVPSDREEDAKDAAGPTELEEPVVPVRRKLAISGNLPPNNVEAHVESAGACKRGRSSTPTKFSADEREGRRRECVNVRRWGRDDFSEEGGATGADSERHVTGAVNRQQAMDALELEDSRKVRKKKCDVARPNDKLVVGARVLHNRKRLDRTERSKGTDIDLLLKGSGRSKRCTTHSPQRQRESGYV